MDKRWTLKPLSDPLKVEELTNSLNIDQVLANLLLQRGINTFEGARLFFRPELDHLHDPFLMKDMDRAVERIEQAVAKGESILVYGDYDVDGTTAVAAVLSYLRQFHPKVDYYIPDRYSEGYGVSLQGIDHAAANGHSLIIALDCGIKAQKQVEYAREKGIDFIICDHHLPDDHLPLAVAILDPKRPDCEYPYKELSGCGIGVKLIQALATNQGMSIDAITPYLDLAAISIACDIVPVTGENRVLQFYGLRQLNEAPRTGLKVLIDLADKKGELTVLDLVFMIGPKINAAGRMEHGSRAVELLISEDVSAASNQGKKIDQHNKDRREVDQNITKEALAIIEENESLVNAKSTVLFDPDWHKGVIGIVASRLIERYHRPTIIFTHSNGVATGSARSVKGFDIYEALHSCADLLEQFGGHKYAAGMTIKEEHLPAFQKKFEEVVSKTIHEDCLIPEVQIDSELHFSQVTPKFFRILKQLAPFGPGNMRPVFVSYQVRDSGYSKPVGANGDHLKLDLIHPDRPDLRMSGIAFNMGHHAEQIQRGAPFNILYTIEENEWQGVIKLQLKVRDIRFE